MVALFFVSAAALIAGCSRPETAVTDAIEAARDGDREAYAECFTRRSRPLLALLWGAVDRARAEGRRSDDPLRLSAGRISILSVEPASPGDDGQARAGVTVREGSGKSLKLLLHRRGGAWRIDLVDTERALTGFGGPF